MNEPIQTHHRLEPHLFTILCGDEYCMSSWADFDIIVWKLPPLNHHLSASHGHATPFLSHTLRGLNDGIWTSSLDHTQPLSRIFLAEWENNHPNHPQHPLKSPDIPHDIACHEAMPLIISTHENRKARFYNVGTGKQVDEMDGYKYTLTSAAIGPSRLHFGTVGRDCSLRVWGVGSKWCDNCHCIGKN